MAPPEVVERVALAPAPGEAPLPADNAAALLRRTAPTPISPARPALRFGDQICHPRPTARGGRARYAALCSAQRLDPDRPPHVAVLLDNTPEYVFGLAGAGLVGAALVGLNHTRRDEHLLADIAYTDVQLVITEPRHQELLAPVVGGLDLPGGVLVSSASPTATIPRPPWASPWPRPSPPCARRRGSRPEPDVGCLWAAAVHLGHVGRTQSGALHPAAAAHHRATG